MVLGASCCDLVLSSHVQTTTVDLSGRASGGRHFPWFRERFVKKGLWNFGLRKVKVSTIFSGLLNTRVCVSYVFSSCTGYYKRNYNLKPVRRKVGWSHFSGCRAGVPSCDFGKYCRRALKLCTCVDMEVV